MTTAGPTTAVVAEKPSVARDLARVLGASRRGEGYLHGNGWVVTWAIGHLVTLPEPHQIRPEWKRWSSALLPMLPARWPLAVIEDTRQQFEVVRRILTSPKVGRVVCATDAGREGELIFRLICEAAACTKPIARLWVSSLTEDAIRHGFATLREGRELDALADAARGRAQADWLVGMNLSRACSLAWGETLPVGRVQTPTLALLVERELAIRSFVPEDYLEVAATFATGEGACYAGTWFRGATPTAESKRLTPSDPEVARILGRARAGRASIETVRREKKPTPPPMLYDLTELQRHANRLYGFSAQKTLALAQSLYESAKLLSYPRTDSRHLSTTVAATLPAIVRAIEAPYAGKLAPETGERPLGRRFVDDAKVTEHHAIIPTGAATAALDLSEDERKIYDLVCRRLLQAWHQDLITASTTVVTCIDAEGVRDRYASAGSSVEQAGWKVLEVPSRREEKKDPDLPGGLTAGREVQVTTVEPQAKRTRPPQRFTDASLLTAMETAGAALDDRELSDAMKERGLGTPATRAETIETLLRHGYCERQQKAIAATDKGVRLIERVHPHVKSPAMTGEWEAELTRIQRGQGKLTAFMVRIETFVRDVVAATLAAAKPTEPGPPAERVQPPPASLETPARDLVPPERLGDLLPRFGLERFRPFQERACRAVAQGLDVLLVMPTGAGKSLCYQLPGLARGGATLVVSPLIALMEDQTASLRARGIAADRIHSGRDRAVSRQALDDYLAGRLDFLFVAPERLGIRGFAEELLRRKPTLVAIDEAHCISLWGHDFRPDYRLLGERLPQLRPAPVIALTATATPLVQDDIAVQLGLARTQRLIHGFRRSNIAVEFAEAPAFLRPALVERVLAHPDRRPAIVYAPTRKESEALADRLGPTAAAYHAGMPSARRDRVQRGFMSGSIEVIVATIAFGMGIDKRDVRSVVHTGLPSSLEGYYQEIGRAGRDGLPSRALLLHAWADRRTHEFFHGRNYPEPAVLKRIYDALRREPQPKAALQARVHLDDDEFASALEKLWVHSGARIDAEENVSLGAPGWRKTYEQQRELRRTQLDLVTRCTSSHRCRMLLLVEHFGDREDSGQPCGTCDVCAPAECLAREFRPPTPVEAAVARRVVELLRQRDGLTTGQLHRDAGGPLERRAFEEMVGGLTRSGVLWLEDDSFEKEGRQLRFQRARLTQKGRAALETDRLLITVELGVAPQAAPRRRGDRKRGRVRTGSAVPAVKPAKAARPGEPAEAVVAALKAWRLGEARRRQVPAFHVLHDRVLLDIASALPRSEEALLALRGWGPKLHEKYGSALLAVIARSASA